MCSALFARVSAVLAFAILSLNNLNALGSNALANSASLGAGLPRRPAMCASRDLLRDASRANPSGSVREIEVVRLDLREWRDL
jgi:hypothetical protein